MKKMLEYALLTLACVLLLSGCAGTVKGSTPTGQTAAPLDEPSSQPSESAAPVGTVTIEAKFQREDGTPLSGVTIRISDGNDSTDYSLDDGGALLLSGLPKSGERNLSILDQREQEAASMALRFTTGAVIDATTDADGVGHISLKEETDEMALDFTWNDDGSLNCTLRLSQAQLAEE